MQQIVSPELFIAIFLFLAIASIGFVYSRFKKRKAPLIFLVAIVNLVVGVHSAFIYWGAVDLPQTHSSEPQDVSYLYRPAEQNVGDTISYILGGLAGVILVILAFAFFVAGMERVHRNQLRRFHSTWRYD